MSDEIKTSDESRESSSSQNENGNTSSKRVFILTSEMVKRLGLDEKIKIFKDKVKVDTSIKPVSVVQIDKDKTQLIIRESSNKEIDSDSQNKSVSNGEGSNDTKDVDAKSDILPVNSENEKKVGKKDKEASKKSTPVITHHVETLEKPLILRRSPTKNGIVVLKTPNTEKDNQRVLSVNKLKVIGDQKTVGIKPLGVKKSGPLVPRGLVRTPTNTGTRPVNSKPKVNNDAAKKPANSEDDIIFIDSIKSNKNNSLEVFKRPSNTYSRTTRKKDSQEVNASNTNSKALPGSKVIKLSTINSNASRDTILSSQDLVQQPTEELEKILQTVNVEIEEVCSKDPKSSKKKKNASPIKKRKRKPPKAKKVKVIQIFDEDELLFQRKRGRPRRYFTKESLEKLKSLKELDKKSNNESESSALDENSEDLNLNKKLELDSNKESESSALDEKKDLNLNKKLEPDSNKESESSTVIESTETQILNKKLEDSNSNENPVNSNLKRELEVSSLIDSPEHSNLNKKLKTSDLNEKTENNNLNEELNISQSNKSPEIINVSEISEISNLNNELTDKKPVLDHCEDVKENNASDKIQDSTKVENNLEDVKHKIEKKEEEIPVETPVEVPVVRRGRGRPRRTISKPPTPIVKEQVPNTTNVDVNDNADNNTDAGDNTTNNAVADNNDNKVNDDDDDDDEGDEDDYDYDDENSTRYRRFKGMGGRRKAGWYIKPVSQGGPDKVVKKKENKNKEIQCGKCDEKMVKSKWTHHNLTKHNNTGWLSGNKEPDFEGNEKLWRKVLTDAIKKKKGSLNCEKCNAVKRSVVGFISHYKFCGKTQEEKDAMMWICPICEGVFMPSSQDFHERVHREEMRQAARNAVQVVINDENVLNGDGKKKRRAAEKATNKILEFTKIVKDESSAKKRKKEKSKIDDLIEKPHTVKKLPNVWKGMWAKDIAAKRPAKCRQPSCTFSATSLDEICDHFRQCNFTPRTEFICKICKFFSKSQDATENHVKSVHPEKLNSGEDSDFNINELSDGSVESDNNNEEINEGTDNPENDLTRDPKKYKLRQFDKFTSYTRAQFLRCNEVPQFNTVNTTYTPTLRWTMQFELDNYKSKLFENLIPNDFNLLTNTQAQDYLPELKVSMKTKQMKNISQNFEFVKIKIIKEENLTEEEIRDKGWKSFKLFESGVINNVPTFFVGGPVWSMAWLPIPAPMYSHNINQYLAISTHPTMETKYTVSKSYKFKNIIQIWNVGHLDHTSSSTPTPKLSYIVTHNNGTIWCMEWCPSGAYHHPLLKNNIAGESMKRMGLLATASSDGNVHIYSLPFPEELNFNITDDNDLPIYQTNPVVTLHINRLLSQQNKINWQCTSLSWSKVCGHDTIAAGFSNGYIALWDLTTKSPLLVTKNADTIHMNAFQHFYAHGHAVTYVGIVPINGKSFLASVSLDRCTKVWDLEDPYCSIDTVKKGAGTNGAWLTHWLNIYTCYDDALGLAHTVSYMMGVRDPPSSVFPLLPTNSTTYGLAVSDYANGICHGTLAGDITAIFPFQMLYIKDIDKLTKKRWLVSSVELVDFGENTESENNSEPSIDKDNEESNNYKNMTETYDACKDRFGIVYHDDLNNFKSNLVRKTNRRNPVNSETMNTVPLEQYQFTSVNRLAWNQNSWSYLWVAAGYQNGLIRILNLKSMSVDNAVMKLLPDHADLMMRKFNNEQAPSET